jgi:hypothetical protein
LRPCRKIKWALCSPSFGRIAQSVEQRTENPCVAGSIPVPANISLKKALLLAGKEATAWRLSGIEVKVTCDRTGFQDDEVARKDSSPAKFFLLLEKRKSNGVGNFLKLTWVAFDYQYFLETIWILLQTLGILVD